MDMTPCAALLAGDFGHLHAYVKTDEAKLVLAAFAGMRVFAGYCRKSCHIAARDLAAGLIIASAFTLLFAAEQAKVPGLVRHIFNCKAPGSPERLPAPGTWATAAVSK